MWWLPLLDQTTTNISNVSEGVTIPLGMFIGVITTLGAVAAILFWGWINALKDNNKQEIAHSGEMKLFGEQQTAAKDKLRDELREEYNDLVEKYMLLGEKTANEIQASTIARAANEKALTDLFALLRGMHAEIVAMRSQRPLAGGG